MILEGIVTTLNPNGTVNIAPMGPRVDSQMRHVVLRPFQSSTTYRNLKAHGEGVLHVTDDVWLLARAAVAHVEPVPPMIPAQQVRGQVLSGACRWYEFRVLHLDDSQDRTTIDCEILHSGRLRDFFGFNRAKHAVLEAAILATRTAFLPIDHIQDEFQRLSVLIEKTGGEEEQHAFQFLLDYVNKAAAQQPGANAQS